MRPGQPFSSPLQPRDYPLLVAMGEAGATPQPFYPLDLNLLRFYDLKDGNTVLNASAAPAAAAEQIATIVDLSGNFDAAQTVNSRRPVRGTDLATFDGVDDTMDVGLMGGQVVYIACFRSVAPVYSNYYGVVETVGAEATRWGLFEPTQKYFHTNPTLSGVRYDGVAATGPTFPNPGSVDTFHIITVKTATGASAPRSLMQLQDSLCGNAELKGLIVLADNPLVDSQDVLNCEAWMTSRYLTP